MAHKTVNTVFINIASGEEIKELPSKFDRDALKPRLVLSTHLAWKDAWAHYKVLQVEEQAGETVVVHVKRMRRYVAPGLMMALIAGTIVVTAVIVGLLWFLV